MESSNEPDLTKPFSRWNAPYWAMMHGVAAALEHSEWKLLSALYTFLPDVHPGKGRLEARAGISKNSVKRGRRRLRELGLINFPENLLGGDRSETTTQYELTDIRQPTVAAKIVAKITGAMMARDQSTEHSAQRTEHPGAMMGSDTGAVVAPPRGHDGPDTGAIVAPKVHNQSPQVRTQDKAQCACGTFGADAPAVAEGIAVGTLAASSNTLNAAQQPTALQNGPHPQGSMSSVATAPLPIPILPRIPEQPAAAPKFQTPCPF